MILRTVKQARATFAVLSPDEIRSRATRPLHIGLVADGSAAYAEMEDFLIPATVPRMARLRLMAQVHRANDPGVPETVDLILYEPGIGCPPGAFNYHRDNPAATVSEVLAEKRDLALPLSRQFPAFRNAVLDDIIHTVARENALFAVATALPNVIPSLVELPWSLGEFASDTLFLTANQVRMAFQIAAACGKDSGFTTQKAEILTIAAGAFGWRALARELVSHIPLGGGLIPKGAIAYAGTYVAGKGLELLHRHNGLHTRTEQRDLYREGLARGKAVIEPMAPPVNRPAATGHRPL
ncbi:MAG TPA: hypothetical protein VNY05_39260 [Candidatus Acidoferrales bacterium]|nr:hypothetical protein [Candidatus Acidoferrales bacterium]